MTPNVQDFERDFWGNSPCIDMRDPSSLASLPHHPAKPICLETERGSGRREYTHHFSVAQPAAQTVDLNSEMADGPPTSTEFSQVNLGEWHPQYLACMKHFLDQGQHLAAVQTLAAFINIRLPCQRLSDPVTRFMGSRSVSTDHGRDSPTNTFSSSHLPLRPYVRRLIVTGQDTPAVLEAFFGEEWLDGVGCIFKQERINYLFAAKSGGWAATKAAYDILPDEHAPFLRPIRDASEEELRMAESRWSEWLAMEDWMVGSRSPW